MALFHWYPAAALKLLLPLGLLVVGALSLDALDDLTQDPLTVAQNMPYVLSLVAMLMSYQLNRLRLMLAATGVAVFYWIVQHHLQTSLTDPATQRSYLAISLALPVLGYYCLLLPERGIWNLYGFVFCAAAVGLVLLCVQLGPWLPEVNTTAARYYSPWPWEGFVLSRGAGLLTGLVVLLGVGLLLLRNDVTEAALVGAFAALAATLAWLHLPQISVAMGCVAASCLVWGLLRSSHSMAYQDELTGLPSRRALNERIQMLGSNYSIAMLDVDHFKRFNDTHGHDVGDEVLRLVASRLRKVGGGGTAYRYGGEEFCIIFPRRGAEDCVEPLTRLREEIADYQMSIRDKSLRPLRAREGAKRRGATRLKSSQVSVTVSAGLASRGAENPDAESVIAAADRFLYKAKRAGRNRVAAEVEAAS